MSFLDGIMVAKDEEADCAGLNPVSFLELREGSSRVSPPNYTDSVGKKMSASREN